MEQQAAAKSPGHDLEPGDVLDDFEIVSVLARSGMGSVFKARRRSTQAMVVLKVPHMRFECDVMFFARFQREERIGLRLDHPSIAKVIAYADKSRQYLVMEHVQGQSLWRLMLDGERRISVERVLDMGRNICEALAYMHGEGVVHRDLKPENIVVDANDGIHIVDFGIALDLSASRLTWGHFSARLGTPQYMAPEQVAGKRGDARTDVYALGLILYEMLAGAPAFAARGPVAAMKARTQQDPHPLADVAPGLDAAVAALVMRALARDPRDRYTGAEEMLEALRHPSLALASPERCPSRCSAAAATRGRALAGAGVICALLLTLLWLVVGAR
jgi:eukaryotic-like serine/threonine-protein kinase